MREPVEHIFTDENDDALIVREFAGHLFFKVEGTPAVAGGYTLVGFKPDDVKKLIKFLKKWLKENDEG
jgi:hypothetical protein